MVTQTEATSPNSPWLTVEEAAGYLRCQRRTLLVWVRQGKVRGYQLSGKLRHVWRFRREDLDAVLDCVTEADVDGVVDLSASSVARVIQ
jgi:excisionase family DNA binding protein